MKIGFFLVLVYPSAYASNKDLQAERMQNASKQIIWPINRVSDKSHKINLITFSTRYMILTAYNRNDL